MAALIFVLFAIGDPCPNGDECPPGEVCVGSADPAYCTARCPPEGCPEGFFCRNSGGVEVCDRGLPPDPVEFGEACGPEDPCAEGLFCATATGDDRFCTRVCTGFGTCPQGYRCAMGETPACAPLNGQDPGFGNNCGEGGACAEGLLCHMHPRRMQSFCTTDCEAGGPCGSDWVCEGERCVPPGEAGRPGFGQACIPEEQDPVNGGCEGELVCHQEGATNYCTGACDATSPCPEGYGCVEVEARRGECRRGVENSPIFEPQAVVDVPSFETPVDAGALPMAEPVETEEGCECRNTGGGTAWAILVVLLGLWRPRRR